MSSLTNHLKRHLVHFLCLTPKKKKIEQLHLSQYKKTIRIQQQGKGYQPQYVAGSDHHYSEHVDSHYSHLELEELPQGKRQPKILKKFSIKISIKKEYGQFLLSTVLLHTKYTQDFLKLKLWPKITFSILNTFTIFSTQILYGKQLRKYGPTHFELTKN